MQPEEERNPEIDDTLWDYYWDDDYGTERYCGAQNYGTGITGWDLG